MLDSYQGHLKIELPSVWVVVWRHSCSRCARRCCEVEPLGRAAAHVGGQRHDRVGVAVDGVRLAEAEPHREDQAGNHPGEGTLTSKKIKLFFEFRLK